MRVSLNAIKQYTDIDLSVDELVSKINAQLGGVEKVIDLGERYKDAVIVRVVSCDDHADADRLHVCKIDDGGVVKDVERDENGLVQVVCGAPNVKAGMFVVWLPPKSTVPSSFDDKELFVLEARALRGVVSNGMLASAKELAIGDSHDGILEIDPSEWKPNNVEIKPGTSFAKAYGLDDTIIDIENKMFTHRPDLFGQIGVAREIAGIQHKKFTSPEWYMIQPGFSNGDGLALEVFNDAPDEVPRFMAVAIKNVTIKPSPLWLQIELVRLGGKPINSVVDATNYVMLLTAQPTHAYDYDKLRGHKIGARMAKHGETVMLLNGKTYELNNGDIVISDGEGPVGLAGIMGGGESEVSSETRNIVLEVANFDMYTVRRSSMRHGVFTDALTRFNKGQSVFQNNVVLAKLMELIGGEQASAVFDLHDGVVFDEEFMDKIDGCDTTREFINNRLGTDLKDDEIKDLLLNVEFRVKFENAKINVFHPFWRTDIYYPEDIVEEVGRLYGFDKLPRELPSRSTKPAAQNAVREQAHDIRQALSRAGASEVLTYSFVHKNVMERAGQDPAHAYKLSNALSPDLQYYRLSLTPSLLDKVHMNIKAGYDQFALFEMNKVHYKGEMDSAEPGVPNEDGLLALTIAYSDKQKPAGSPYYYARRYLDQIANLEGLTVMSLSDFDVSSDEWGRQLTAAYEPNRSAVIVKDDEIWGVVGEYKEGVKRAFKLPDFAAGFEIHQDVIVQPGLSYSALSKYPSTDRDICFQVPREVSYGRIIATMKTVQRDEVKLSLAPLDIYQPDDEVTKNITVRVTLAPQLKTLSSEEAQHILDDVASRVVSELGATVI